MLKSIYIFKVTLTLLYMSISVFGNSNAICPISKYCICTTQTYLSCINFPNFSELNFTTNDLSSAYEFIQIEPSPRLAFDKQVNLNGIRVATRALVRLENIKSFQFEVNPFASILEENGTRINKLEIYKSNLEFTYTNGVTLLADKCKQEFVNLNEIRPLFAEFNNVLLGDTVKYDGIVCPFIFKSVKMQSLIVYNLSSLNSLQFAENTMPLDGVNELASRINTLEIYQSKITFLDTRLLSKYVFKYLENLIIVDTSLGEIDERLFSHFDHIKTIQLKLNNFDTFFQKNKTKWLVNLNLNQSGGGAASSMTNPNKQILIGFLDNDHKYSYPDEDLCLFKDFPHDSNVFVYIQNANKEYTCTCTLVWLLKNWRAYTLFSLNNTSVAKCLRDEYLQSKISECKFEQTLKQCDSVEPVDVLEKQDGGDFLWIIAVPFFVILIFLVFALSFKILYKNNNNNTNKVESENSSRTIISTSSRKSFNSINKNVPSIKTASPPLRSSVASSDSSLTTGIVPSNPEMRLVSSGRLTPPNFEDFPPNHDQRRKTVQREKSKIWIP
jgi:hypothetical protein